MAKIVVTGGGLIGLSTAMLLADDGHEVTVLERDPAGPPAVADEAWTEWERRGVNQFRMIHFFLPRFRLVMEKELPRVIEAFDAAGALRLNPLKDAPPELTGGFRDGDEIFEAVTARRPVGETVVATLAESTPGVTVRRGVAVVGLITGTPVTPGVPNVTGVLTESGEEISADLVVDATGRRSPLPTWLADAGARPPDEELDDCGFIYYGRHFRSADGSVPFALGGLLQHYDSVSMLTLPADNGTWGVGVITSAKDPTLRALRDVDTWTRVVRSYPLIAHWLDGSPIDEQVAVMAKIEDRHRDFVVDGTPVVTGLVAVGDSWACTNPSVGRGISIGVLHAVALRDLVRSHDLNDPLGVAKEWHDITIATVEPFFRSTLAFDRHRLAEIDAQIAGVPYEPDDPGWKLGQRLQAGVGADPELLRGFLKIATLNATPEEVFADNGMIERALRVGGPLEDTPAPGPNRAELLAAVAG
ncbi:MAG TPA: FAD-dependent oxidoreductase [Acidimicrobiales bacterium]|jgi:2-polyprenyl-6-methoxyphenol hydroxylase-like FAD-dependent oxidoreductase